MVSLSHPLVAQKNAKVIFNFNPPSFISEITIHEASEKLREDSLYVFNESFIRIRYSSDFYITLDTLVQLSEDSVNVINLKLQPNQEYVEFRENRNEYLKLKNDKVIAPTAAIITIGSASVFTYLESLRFPSKVDILRKEYLAAGPDTREVQQVQDKLNILKRNTRIKRTVSTIGITLSTIAWFVQKKRNQKFKQDFYQEHLMNKTFTFDSYQEADHQGITLSYNF